MPHAHSTIPGWDSVVRYHLVPVLVAGMFAAYAKSSTAFRAMLVGADANQASELLKKALSAQ